MRRYRKIILAMTVVVIVAVVGAVAFTIWPRGVTARVANMGLMVMQEVRLAVRGQSYPLGDIPSGASRDVQVWPTGESNINIHYIDASGTSRSIEVDCYLEPGYRGTIAVEVAEGSVVRLIDNTRHTPW